METKVFRLDLGVYQTPGAKVFTGRPRGKKVRSDSKIDILETQYDKILVVIPESIESINPSFLEELFNNVVKKMGREEFFKRFEFENFGEYKVGPYLEEAIERILEDQNALP